MSLLDQGERLFSDLKRKLNVYFTLNLIVNQTGRGVCVTGLTKSGKAYQSGTNFTKKKEYVI